MHSNEREAIILELIDARGFVSFRDLERQLDGSPATIRRDLERLAQQKKLVRVRGGAKSAENGRAPLAAGLTGASFDESINLHRREKEAIGRTAASYCQAGEAVMIDGGTTTFHMCRHLDGLNLQVLTNSLHIVNELIRQPDTRILVPSGTVFREQNIILPAFGEDGMPRFHAPKLFMGAGSIGPQGLMQTDVILVAAERRLIERAEEIYVLVDSSKFDSPSGTVVSTLEEIDVVISDARLADRHAAMVERAGARLVIAGDD